MRKNIWQHKSGEEKLHQHSLIHNLTHKWCELKVRVHYKNISQMQWGNQSLQSLSKEVLWVNERKKKKRLQLTTAMMPSYEWSSLFWIDAITSNACPARSVTITWLVNQEYQTKGPSAWAMRKQFYLSFSMRAIVSQETMHTTNVEK